MKELSVGLAVADVDVSVGGGDPISANVGEAVPTSGTGDGVGISVNTGCCDTTSVI